jgi:hypothetical protein
MLETLANCAPPVVAGEMNHLFSKWKTPDIKALIFPDGSKNPNWTSSVVKPMLITSV